MYACTYICAYACIHVHIHTHTHTHALTHTNKLSHHTHSHVHTHAHIFSTFAFEKGRARCVASSESILKGSATPPICTINTRLHIWYTYT